ncbi:MAG: hypothetical protein FK733_13070 [Asgard group archaeon]|nr:hypothetical protein [Asgard group archaeon]
MSVQIKTLDDYGFLLSLIGGVITVIFGILGFIVNLASDVHWFFGSGFIGMANEVAGSVISIIFGVLAILLGLKLFFPKIREIIAKIDLIIIAIIMLVIGIIVFGIGGIIIIVGGILVLVYRLQKQ